MHHGARRPRAALDPRHVGNQLRRHRRVGTKAAKRFRAGSVSGTSSPVMTHERVIGSLRNSMAVRKTSLQTARQLRLLTDIRSPFFATFALGLCVLCG